MNYVNAPDIDVENWDIMIVTKSSLIIIVVKVRDWHMYEGGLNKIIHKP